MTDNVIISIKGKQLYAESGPDEMELVTSGVLKRDSRGGFLVSYQESELTGLEGTTTKLHVHGGRVTLLREGGVNSQMIFQRGKRYSSLYETPWGSILVDVATTTLASRLNERGGVLEVRYTIAVDHRVTGENRFKIRVRERV